jgi:flagellar biosynthesis protein FliP
MRARSASSALLGLAILVPLAVWGAPAEAPLLADADKSMSSPMRLLLVLTALSLLPSMLIALTAFTRIIIVLAMLRQAIGMPETPPNVVLLSLAMFLTVFTMMPVWKVAHETAVQPYLEDQLGEKEAAERAMVPIRKFMAAQTRSKDLALMLELAGEERPVENLDEVSTFHLIPAFMLSELRRAFEIGFIIFLPFIAIDIIVASVLMSLGMIMVPPMAFSLPIKILLFVLIDGWNLLASSLVRSFVVA